MRQPWAGASLPFDAAWPTDHKRTQLPIRPPHPRETQSHIPAKSEGLISNVRSSGGTDLLSLQSNPVTLLGTCGRSASFLVQIGPYHIVDRPQDPRSSPPSCRRPFAHHVPLEETEPIGPSPALRGSMEEPPKHGDRRRCEHDKPRCWRPPPCR